jgi:hypothetical protein
MALSQRSEASRAVLLSLFAFASRHRGNDMTYAARAKNAAIDALISATDTDMDFDTGVEHIAAGLTLCLVEVSVHPEKEKKTLTQYRHIHRPILIAIG